MITLRAANFEDAKLLLRWRNDPSAYEYFFNSKPVSRKEHQEWLGRLLIDPKRKLFIIDNEERHGVGHVRFDTRGEEAEISITIGPEFRGQGCGKSAIVRSSQFFLEQHPEVKKIVAQIKADNDQSLHVFKKADYLPVSKKDGVIRLELIRA